MDRCPEGDDALDLLEDEDRLLCGLFDRFARQEDQLEHGVIGKLLVKHLAIREAAKEMVSDALVAKATATELALKLQANTMRRREMLAHLDEMAHGVKPMDLNQGQEFDTAMEPLLDLVNAEMAEELDDVLPALRQQLAGEKRTKLFPSAKYVRRHAPTHPNPHAKHRYERFGSLARLHAFYDLFREYPNGRRWVRSHLPDLTVHYQGGRLEGFRYRLASRHPDPTVEGRVLADRVRSALGPLEHRLDIPRVHVMADGHNVILHGDVTSEQQVQTLVEAVRSIPGVRRVASHLHVGLFPGDSRPSEGRTFNRQRAAD